MEIQERSIAQEWIERLIVHIQGIRHKQTVEALTEPTLIKRLKNVLEFDFDEFTAAAYLMCALAEPRFNADIRMFGQNALEKDARAKDLVSFDTDLESYIHYHGLTKVCENFLLNAPLSKAAKERIVCAVTECLCKGRDSHSPSPLFAALFTAQCQLERMNLKTAIREIEAKLETENDDIQRALNPHRILFNKKEAQGTAMSDATDHYPNARSKFLDLP